MPNYSPAVRDAISRADIKRQMKTADENARYWNRRKVVDPKPEDKALAGGLARTWETQVATLQAKLAALS